MAKKSPVTCRKLFLGDRGALGRVHVGMEAFFEFSFWMAEELEDLVSQNACRSSSRNPRDRVRDVIRGINDR